MQPNGHRDIITTLLHSFWYFIIVNKYNFFFGGGGQLFYTILDIVFHYCKYTVIMNMFIIMNWPLQRSTIAHTQAFEESLMKKNIYFSFWIMIISYICINMSVLKEFSLIQKKWPWPLSTVRFVLVHSLSWLQVFYNMLIESLFCGLAFMKRKKNPMLYNLLRKMHSWEIMVPTILRKIKITPQNSNGFLWY